MAPCTQPGIKRPFRLKAKNGLGRFAPSVLPHYNDRFATDMKTPVIIADSGTTADILDAGFQVVRRIELSSRARRARELPGTKRRGGWPRIEREAVAGGEGRVQSPQQNRRKYFLLRPRIL